MTPWCLSGFRDYKITQPKLNPFLFQLLQTFWFPHFVGQPRGVTVSSGACEDLREWRPHSPLQLDMRAARRIVPS